MRPMWRYYVLIKTYFGGLQFHPRVILTTNSNTFDLMNCGTSCIILFRIVINVGFSNWPTNAMMSANNWTVAARGILFLSNASRHSSMFLYAPWFKSLKWLARSSASSMDRPAPCAKFGAVAWHASPISTACTTLDPRPSIPLQEGSFTCFSCHLGSVGIFQMSVRIKCSMLVFWMRYWMG